jgi:hypothetical protein
MNKIKVTIGIGHVRLIKVAQLEATKRRQFLEYVDRKHNLTHVQFGGTLLETSQVKLSFLGTLERIMHTYLG